MFEKLLGEVKGIFNTITLIEMGIAILFIIFGLVFFSASKISTVVLGILVGLLLISKGVESIFAYLRKGRIDLFNNDLVFGIILVIIGVISLFTGKILSIMLGIYFIVSGGQKINYGIFLKKFNESSWLITTGLGVMFIVIGIVAFFTSSENVVSVTGICLLGYGVMNLVSVILLRRRSKYFIA